MARSVVYLWTQEVRRWMQRNGFDTFTWSKEGQDHVLCHRLPPRLRNWSKFRRAREEGMIKCAGFIPGTKKRVRIWRIV